METQVDRRSRDVGPPAGVAERRKGERRHTEALKMACPFCGASQSLVESSRGAIVADQVRRRRRCAECRRRFPTKEEVDWECLQAELAGQAAARSASSTEDDQLKTAA